MNRRNGKRLLAAAVSMMLLAGVCTAGYLPASALETERQTKAVEKQETEAPKKEESAAETQPETQASPKPETQSETQSETQAPSQSETQPEAQTPSQSETQPMPQAPSQSEVLPEISTEPTSSRPVQGEDQTESQTPEQSETQLPQETQTEIFEQQSETSLPGTGQTESETQENQSESETLTEAGMLPEAESEAETESESETDPPVEEAESKTSKYASNEELVAHQNIVIPPKLELEFRFTQIEKRYAVVSNREGTFVYEEKSEDSRHTGILEYHGLCYILEDEKDGWYYIESGNVRGFIKEKDALADEAAKQIISIEGAGQMETARLLLARSKNEAFTYTHTTVQTVIAPKVYAIAAKTLQIREAKKESSRATGTLEKGGLCYILAGGSDEWIFVESGDVRGFVKKSSLLTGNTAREKVSVSGEANMKLADQKVKPQENKACYYTLTSVKEASQEAKTREAMVNFALQFLGNPYVWGGTSLTNGADCSGFVQSVYSHFGYSLPRVADAQSVYGMQIPISSAEPGDLIFYARNGYVYHVSMYIGNNQVVHAAGRKLGIITSGISGNAVWATRVISG